MTRSDPPATARRPRPVLAVVRRAWRWREIPGRMADGSPSIWSLAVVRSSGLGKPRVNGRSISQGPRPGPGAGPLVPDRPLLRGPRAEDLRHDDPCGDCRVQAPQSWPSARDAHQLVAVQLGAVPHALPLGSDDQRRLGVEISLVNGPLAAFIEAIHPE